MQILGFDVDGTLTATKSGEKFKQNSGDIQVIPGVKQKLQELLNEENVLIGYSNQGGVAAGYKSLKDAIAETQNTLELLPELMFIYFCPDYEGNFLVRVHKHEVMHTNRSELPEHESCESFRKPSHGMLRKASLELNIPVVSFVGDREEDQACALNAGVKFTWASDWLAGDEC